MVPVRSGQKRVCCPPPTDFNEPSCSVRLVEEVLVVMATPGDFRMVEAALGKLDIPPLQVLIEATIA